MRYFTRKLVKPGDLNPCSSLFGGRLLEWVDEECAIFATCQLGNSWLVTKLISEISFVAPARQGDVVEIGVEAVAFGNTSIVPKCATRTLSKSLPPLTRL